MDVNELSTLELKNLLEQIENGELYQSVRDALDQREPPVRDLTWEEYNKQVGEWNSYAFGVPGQDKDWVHYRVWHIPTSDGLCETFCLFSSNSGARQFSGWKMIRGKLTKTIEYHWDAREEENSYK